MVQLNGTVKRLNRAVSAIIWVSAMGRAQKPTVGVRIRSTSSHRRLSRRVHCRQVSCARARSEPVVSLPSSIRVRTSSP